MNENFYLTTLNKLKQISIVEKSALVFYSGGKDSTACLDMAKKIFNKVVCIFMYFLPDLDYNKKIIEKAKENNVELLQYPHWLFFELKRNGVYDWKAFENIPKITLQDIINFSRKETGINIILHGAKKSDSLWRRQVYNKKFMQKDKNIIYPLWEFSKYEVLAYCKINNLNYIQGATGNNDGVDLTKKSLMNIYNNFPNDFKEIEKYFPFVKASIKHSQIYDNIKIKED